MDRDLRIRMLLEAGDRVTKPLRAIGGASKKTAEDLKATRDRLKEIDRAQADIAEFRKLKLGLRGADSALEEAKGKATALGRALATAEAPTREMRTAFNQAKREADALERSMVGDNQRLDELRTRLDAAGVATSSLVRDERRLREEAARTTAQLGEQGRRMVELNERTKRFAQARAAFDRMQGRAAGMAASGAAAIGTGVAMGTPVLGAVKAAQEYESVMTDIGQKNDLSRGQAAALGRALLVSARAANQMPAALQEGVDTLAGMGASVADSAKMVTPIGRAATAYKADMKDLAAAAYSAKDNLKVPIAETARVIDAMAQAGKAGAFEIKDMAQYFPALSAGYQALGQRGVPAVADLAAALQIAKKGAGDAASAATNIENVLQKIQSPATIKAFQKMGVDLPAALKRMYAEGKTPLEAIAELTNKTLKGDLGKIGFLFEDAQVQQGLRPLIQNMALYRQIRAEAMNAGGTTDRDFAQRLNDSAEQTKALAINAKILAITLGSQLLPTVNAVVVRANAFATWLGDAASRHPMLTKVVAMGAAAFATLFLVLGAGSIAIAGIMGPIALLDAGLVALGVAGGIASVGLLPIIGTAAAVVAGIAGVAAAAYLIYANWGKITGFFGGLWAGVEARFASASSAVTTTIGGLWAGVKGIFSMSLLDIYRNLTFFTGYVLGSLVRLGSSAYDWLTGTLLDLLTSGFGMALASLKATVTSSLSWLTNDLLAKLERGFTYAMNGFKAAVRSAFNTLPGMFRDFGAMILKGLWNGLMGAPQAVWGLGKKLAQSLQAGFKAGNQIHSPSRVFMRLGGYITEGLAIGLRSGADAPLRRVDALTDRMRSAMAGVAPLSVAAIVRPRVLDGTGQASGEPGRAPSFAAPILRAAPTIRRGADASGGEGLLAHLVRVLTASDGARLLGAGERAASALGVQMGGAALRRHVDDLAVRMAGAMVVGSVLPAAPVAAAPSGARTAAVRTAAPTPAPITIIVNGAPGQSEERLAQLVYEKLRAAQGGAARRSTGYADRADWNDV